MLYIGVYCLHVCICTRIYTYIEREHSLWHEKHKELYIDTHIENWDKKKRYKYIYDVLVCRWLASSLPDRTSSSLFLQLRVIRAFKSTLEDLEERRSVHSLHSLHSMRSSRSHTGPRPLSDFTYIDEDPTNAAAVNAAGRGKNAEQLVVDHARMNSSSTSPLLLTVAGQTAGNAHHHHNTTINTTNNRSSSNSALNQAQQPNHTQMQSSNNRDSNNTGNNTLLFSSNNLALPELTKLVHETSI